MIHLAVDHIVRTLDAYVQLRTGGASGRVVQDVLMEQDGKEKTDAKDKLVVSLVNLEEDRIARSLDLYDRLPDDRVRRVEPEVRVTAYLLFVANLTSYDEALKSLAHVVTFFQNTRYLDFEEIDDLDEPGRLVFEMNSLTFEQINHLWGALGAKYRPSVLYKMRLVRLRDALPRAPGPPVTEVVVRD